ncbi:MAG: hypothetical protein R3231_09840, partial [bacterium]|nr:hypothetical protein [bacterium]
AAINRFKKALNLYPGSGIEDKLIYHLFRTYQTLNDEDHAQEYRTLLEERYPHSEFIPLLTEPEAGSEPKQAVLSAGLGGTYQGTNRNSWTRRLLFLGAREPERQSATALAPASRETQELAERSLVEKIKPW